ncbi:MAG: response regulator [Holophagales bacterium]|nr:response regulator [Holophagales bacterium]
MSKDRQTVFMVDDDATNLAVGASALDGYYDVLTLNSGQKLLKVLERNIPDLILLDVEMPDMSGYDVIKQLKEKSETNQIPVIFLTAKTDGDSEFEGFSLGAIDYITKPFFPPLLLKRLEAHLSLASQKNELVEFNQKLREMVKEKTKAIVELQDGLLKTVANLIERRDGTTGDHVERVQHYLGILIRGMKNLGVYEKESSRWDVDLLLRSSQLHDIGKIGIKDSILQKPGRLTPEEFEEIKKHASIGAQIIADIEEATSEQEFLKYAKIFAASHHERWDGQGYPNRLKGESIPLLGRMMAVADVYDALISERPYKEAFPKEKAVNMIVDASGTQFDPALIEVFKSVLDEL